MKVDFVSSLQTENIDDERDRLIAPFVVVINEETLTIPAGFVTDWSSVPRLPFAYWLTGGVGDRASIVHDYLYSPHAPTRFKERGRAWADRVFKTGLQAQGVSAWKAGIMYAGVRAGGSGHWEDLEEAAL